jgi:hypothetical protein
METENTKKTWETPSLIILDGNETAAGLTGTLTDGTVVSLS